MQRGYNRAVTELGIAIAAALLTIAGTFAIEGWRRATEHRATKRNLRAALAAEMRLVRRALHEIAKRDASRADDGRPATRRIPTPVFAATAGSLGMLESAAGISRLVRLCGAVESLPEDLAHARASGNAATASLRERDLLLGLWQRARELELELSDEDVEQVGPEETALFQRIEREVTDALESTERVLIGSTVMIPRERRR
jgi:hypothetical protein